MKRASTTSLDAATYDFVRRILDGVQHVGQGTRLQEEHIIRLIDGLNLPKYSHTWTCEHFSTFCAALRRLTGTYARVSNGDVCPQSLPQECLSARITSTAPPCKIVNDTHVPTQSAEKDNTRSPNAISATTTLLVVDSDDRDRTAYPTANPFRVHFGYPPSPTKTASTTVTADKARAAFVPHQFHNVEAVALLEAIVPRSTAVDVHPYVLLEVEELGKHFVATNRVVSQCFAKLHLEPYTDLYARHSASRYTDVHVNRKTFSPPIALTTLTFRLRTPSGELLCIPQKVVTDAVTDAVADAVTDAVNVSELQADGGEHAAEAPTMPRVAFTFEIQSRKEAIDEVQVRFDAPHG